jgi:hypothetical protein
MPLLSTFGFSSSTGTGEDGRDQENFEGSWPRISGGVISAVGGGGDVLRFFDGRGGGSHYHGSSDSRLAGLVRWKRTVPGSGTWYKNLTINCLLQLRACSLALVFDEQLFRLPLSTPSSSSCPRRVLSIC